MSSSQLDLQHTIARAVARSDTIGEILVGPGVLDHFDRLYQRFHGDRPALIVADENTYRAAGERVLEVLRQSDIEAAAHILPAEPRPKPTVDLGDALAGVISDRLAVPVAVGSGVINDLVKYAAFRLDTPYSCVATAASMDGYASAGSPLSDQGFKITIQCRPPVAILADLEVIAAAPPQMAGWGYGDLAGKISAGGDWMLADALGIEPIDDVAWPLVQFNLRDWLSRPDAIAAADTGALADLFAGLTLVGLAMEFHGSSRPASGADHQIAHLWEMENLTHRGELVAHGACVSVGTVTVLKLFDWLLARNLDEEHVEAAMARAESLDAKGDQIRAYFGAGQIGDRAVTESRAKHVEGDALRERLLRLIRHWPELRRRLNAQLIPAPGMEDLLRRAGAPVRCEDIGVSRERLKSAALAARFIRSRYTVLDTLAELRLLEQAVDEVFSPQGMKEAAS